MKIVLKVLVAYFAISILTLPFINDLWLGEIPLLAIIQLPKLWVAGSLRVDVVMPLIKALGISRGSFSPDYMLAGPYALVMAYLIPVGAVLGITWARTRMAPPYRRWVWVLLSVVIIDFLMTLIFSSQPGLTIY